MTHPEDKTKEMIKHSTVSPARIFNTLVGLIRSTISGRYWPVLFILMILFFTLMRAVRITADAPPHLSTSAALFTDEGFKTLSAKNKILYGTWKWSPEDQYRSWHKASPFPVFLYEKWFSLFGTGLASIRSLNVLFSTLSMFAIFFLVKKRYDRETAFLALFIFGISHFTSMYQRLGFFENQLVFFSLLSMAAIWNCYDLFKERNKCGQSLSITYIRLLLNLLAALAGIWMGLGTKLSLLLVPFSMLPFFYLYTLYSHHRLNRYVIHHFYLLMAAIAATYFILAHFGYANSLFDRLTAHEVFNVRISRVLPKSAGADNFDPLYLMIANLLMVEFAHIQPVIFFSAILFSLYSYHEFLYSNKLKFADMLFSSWMLFGFLFLALLKYHPSRYYILLVAPLSILSARFFTNQHINLFSEFVGVTKRLSFRKAVAFFMRFYFVFNTGITAFMLFTPLHFRKWVYDTIFFSFTGRRFNEAFTPIALLLLWQTLCFAVLWPATKSIPKFLSDRRNYRALFAIMVFLQLFQYSKWLIFSDDVQHDFSKKLSEELPENAVIFGCWSAGLTIENELRPLVIQGPMNYNIKLIKKIIDNNPIKTNMHTGDSLPPRTVTEQNIPLFLAISKNGNFEGKIRKTYKEYISEKNLVHTERFGYFDILLYRLPRQE